MEEDEEWIKYICGQVKEEIFSTLQSLNSDTERKIHSLSKNLSELSVQIREELNGHSKQLSSQSEDLEANSHLLMKFKQQILDLTSATTVLKDELSVKASIHSVEDIEYCLRSTVDKNDFFELAEKVRYCAKSESLERLKWQVEQCNDGLLIRPTEETLKSTVKSTKKKVKDFINDNFIRSDFVKNLKTNTESKFSKIDDTLKVLDEKINYREEIIMKKLNALKNYTEARPWDHPIQEIKNELSEKAERGDLHELDHKCEQKIKDFELYLESFTGKIDTFANVLERFDEVVLDKASKVDITRLKTALNSYSSKSDFEDHVSIYESKTMALASDIKSLETFSNNLHLSLTHLSQNFNALKRQNYEATILSAEIKEIRDNMKQKADKVDVFQIYDLMSKREDILKLKEDNDSFRKQLEMAVVLVSEMSRTLLQAGEQPNILLKQRTDLYKNAESLVNWLCLSNTPRKRSRRRMRTPRTGSQPIRVLATPKKAGSSLIL